MALNGVLRPGYIQIRVLDLKEALTHYRDRVGLQEVMTDDDGRVFLKGLDEFDHHSVILREADTAGMDFIGFKVLDDATLTDLTAKLEAANVEVERMDAGHQPHVGRAIAFRIPSGHRIEMFAEMDQSEMPPPINNPDVWSEEPRGMRVARFDHALLYGPNVQEVTDLFCDVLGFCLAEKVEGPEGTIAVWLTCSNKAHDNAFVQQEEANKFHHAAFMQENWYDVAHAGDIMSFYNIPIDIGPPPTASREATRSTSLTRRGTGTRSSRAATPTTRTTLPACGPPTSSGRASSTTSAS